MEADEKFRIVLVHPDDGANVGAVCRAMKTMSLKNLVIVGGEALHEERIRTLAVHAVDVYEQAVRTENLEDALRGSAVSAGITRRRGRFRKYLSMTPEQFAEHAGTAGPGIISLVFGNEEHGLTDEELACCDTAVHIPSSPEFPSLNLSHAVQVMTYVLYRSGQKDHSRHVPVTRVQLDLLTGQIAEDLETIGFFTLTGKEEMRLFFRDIFARAKLDSREADRLHGIFTKIRNLKVHKSDTGSTSNSV